MTNSIQFGPDGSVISTESANTLALGASKTNPFNFVDTRLGIANPELTQAVGGNADLAARAAGVSVRQGGSYRVTVGGGEQSLDATQINMAHVQNGEAGVLGTARRHGTPRSADELRATDRVEIGGMETTVENAVRLGFLTREARTGIIENQAPEQLREVDGTADAERAAAQAAKDQADGLAAQEAAKLSPEAEEAALMLATRVDQNTQVRALIELADAGEVSEQAISRAASQAGIDPSDMRTALGKAMDGYSAQAAELLASRGCDPTAFFQWAKVEHPSEVKAAMIGHVQHRNVAAWSGLADRYMANLDKLSPESILNATFDEGVSAHYDPGSRTVVLNIHGQTMSWGAALRAGIIGPHRRG